MEPTRAKPAAREVETTVEDVVDETPTIRTYHLRPQGPVPAWRAGQFVIITPHQFEALSPDIQHLEEQKKKREVARSYSLSSAPHEPRLSVTLKAERYVEGETAYPPLLSPHLYHRIQKGDRLLVSGFTGPYTLPAAPEPGVAQVVHLVAGAGAVPNFSIIKDALERKLPQRHLYVASHRTRDEALFGTALAELARRHPGTLEVVHLFTREQQVQRPDRVGRLTMEVLRDLVPDPGGCSFYVCGPAITRWERQRALQEGRQAAPRFLETALGLLHELGIPESRIKRESFG